MMTGPSASLGSGPRTQSVDQLQDLLEQILRYRDLGDVKDAMSVAYALAPMFTSFSHRPVEGDSTCVLRSHDFEQVVPEVTIDRLGLKPFLIERARGRFPPL